MDEGAKNRLDGWLKLAEYWASRHDGRREFEGKLTLAWWGLLVLAVHYVHSPSIQAISRCEYIGLSASFTLVLQFCFVGLWLYPLWRANTRDKKKSFAAADNAELILLGSEVPDRTDQDIDVSLREFTKDWSMRFQAFTTLLLLTALCIAARY
jgi:hypothetical protein